MSEGDIPAWVFLSYSSKEEEIVERLERDLNQWGIATWRDNQIPPGADWEAEIRKAIRSSHAVVCLASPDARASKNVRGELEVAKMYGKPIYFAWAAGDKWADVVPISYIVRQYADIRENHYHEGFRQLIELLKGLPPVPPISSPPRPQPWLLGIFLWLFKRKPAREKPALLDRPGLPKRSYNPYKGLEPFTMEDKDNFFGRDQLITRMVGEIRHILDIEWEAERRQEPRFLTVVGPSGSGKSSVVMAGLIPRLRQGKDISGSERWTILSPMRPGKEPLEALAQTLLEQLPEDASAEDVLDNLKDNSTRALHRYAGAIASRAGERMVLVVDQFEELFTETVNMKKRQQFIDLLTIAATEPQNKVIIVITLRADFADHPMRYQLLHQIIEAHRIAMPPMTVEDLRAVIERPAKRAGVRFEESLVGDLLLDIHGQEENLPLLQFTLNKLYEERDPKSNRLTMHAYEAMGKVEGALRNHAEETYAALPSDAHRELARDLFIQLINPGGLEQDATRRRVRMSDFSEEDVIRQRQMQETIEHFIRGRLLTTNETQVVSAAGRTSEKVATIEISHEALISAWTRLTDWIKVERDDMLLRQTLNNDIEQWEAQGKPKDRLYDGDQLKRLEALARRAHLNKTEKEFLRQSKQLRGRKRALTGSASVAIIMVAALIGSLAYATAFRPAPVTFIVTSPGDSGPGSLAQVIHDAPAGSTITFDASLHGTIYLDHGDLDIGKDLTFNGPDHNRITIGNRPNGSGHKVHIHANANVTFKNLLFDSGTVQGTAFIVNEGNLTLDHCIVAHNRSRYNGGGITSSPGSSLTLTYSDVHDNQAQGNGGGIYIWQGTLKLDHSTVTNNSANDNGGGVYTINSGLTVSNSTISHNKATGSATSNGGGISTLNGVLVLDSSKIQENESEGYGGGVTLLGSNGFISKSLITQNSARQKGGGLAVEKNSENSNTSLAVLSNIEITNTPKGSYYIGNNHAPSSADVLGIPSTAGGQLTVNNDVSETAGNPAPKNPPERDKSHYLGTVNLDAYCHAQYPQASTSLQVITAEEINCVLQPGERIQPIDVKKACQRQYQQSDVIDRLANYYDPSSWQCYAHEEKLGSIISQLDSFCKSKNYEGVTDNTNGTAYMWNCLRNGAPVSLSVADACQWYYQRSDAFDRLVDFNQPGGWECWAPKQ
ncbi:MAG: TIR domain-containing protein [Ktedonobacteraceae bacterium]|nr:TIR domain-containing protein [Ktedonobacteraceae bacterium]